MNDRPEKIGPHDLGGVIPDGAEARIDREDHDFAHWERQVDAIIYLLGDKGHMTDSAQLRVNIEELGPDAYSAYSYYERWAASAVTHCIKWGLVTEDEIAAKVAEIKARNAAGETPS